MNKVLNCLIILCIGVNHILFGQHLVLTTDSIWFTPTEYGDTTTAVLQITNPGTEPVLVTSIQLGKAYNDNSFGLLSAPLVFYPGIQQLIVNFHPQNDIYYRVPLIINTQNAGGDYCILLCGQGKFASPISQFTENKTGQILKQSVKNYLINHTNLGYNGARDLMYSKCDNINTYVTCLYTARKAQFNSRTGANANNFNAEHVFPQSFFNSNEPMRSDVHHLYSTDETANNIRANYPYGVVSGSPSWQNNGSKYLNGIFEPRDSAKGKVARSLLYFVWRYQDYNSFVAQQENLLLAWHYQFLPDPIDLRRDSIIAHHQGKSNVLVRYPYILNRINSLTGQADFPASTNFSWSSDTIYTKSSHTEVYLAIWNQGHYTLHVDTVWSDTPLLSQISIDQSNISAFSASRCTLSLPQNLASGLYSINAKSGAIVKKVYINHSNTLNILDIHFSPDIEIYPNPAMEVLTIKSSLQLSDLNIYTLTGIKVLSQPFSEQVNLQKLSSGTYILTITDNFGNQFAKKISVVR
ncbi:endonuclease [Schleiferia thermophila]|uniref:endonuclease n=1 Tax=Schleiferia thermophila TaxID=884107 RepID=UPI002FDB2F4C